MYLLLCLKHGELRCLHDTSLNEAETEVVLVFVCPRLPNEAAYLCYLLYERQEDSGIGNVEACVEGSQCEAEPYSALLCRVWVQTYH